MPCKVEHKQGLLQWTKDGFGLGVNRDLPGYSTYSLVGEDGSRKQRIIIVYFIMTTLTGEWNLEISSVTIGDDAIFQCQVGAFGDAPAIRSDPAHLTVMVPPGVPRILQGELIETVEGVETVLECTSSGGRPAGEVSEYGIG